MPPEPATYPGYRFPAEVIRHAVWLYHLFGVSLRDVELILAERGVVVTHESVRQWCPSPTACAATAQRGARSCCTAPGSLDNRLAYAARLKVSCCQAARMSAGLRWPFFSISHSAL